MFEKLYNSVRILKCGCTYSSSNKMYTHLKPPWKVLFFGSDKFSLASLKALYSEYRNGHCISKLEVVTSFRVKKNPIHNFAVQEKLTAHDWPVTVPNNVFHVGVIVSFGHLIPENIINKFPLGMLNVHASLLPRWRGAAPIIYAIAHGDKKTGITIMKLKPHKFDIGEIVEQAARNITDDMKMPELYDELSTLGANVLIKVLRQLPEKLNNAKEQSESGVTFAPRIKPEFSRVKWCSMSARQVYDLDRALCGFFPLTSTWKGIVIKLYDVCKINQESDIKESESSQVQPGCIIYDKVNKVLKVMCADGNWVSIKQVSVTGKKTMSAADFNNGYIKKESVQNRFLT